VADALGLSRPADVPPSPAFDPALTVCADDLAALCARLGRPEASRFWSLCISGPPGTGKSAFAHYLAARLGMPVLQKRASDLLSMWVGGSEKAIAAAFAEARASEALLLIDEVEALLFDRGAATRAFEVSQVDEMLTWMERHPLPFVCTTNLPDRLDSAVPRRFTLKLRFGTLDPARATLAFRRILDGEPPGPLPEGLTPGDFSIVRRKAELLAEKRPVVLAGWLADELAAKGGGRAPIGYRPRPSGPTPSEVRLPNAA
jgi:transitional endoplasmic reticulum ATPase